MPPENPPLVVRVSVLICAPDGLRQLVTMAVATPGVFDYATNRNSPMEHRVWKVPQNRSGCVHLSREAAGPTLVTLHSKEYAWDARRRPYALRRYTRLYALDGGRKHRVRGQRTALETHQVASDASRRITGRFDALNAVSRNFPQKKEEQDCGKSVSKRPFCPHGSPATSRPMTASTEVTAMARDETVCPFVAVG